MKDLISLERCRRSTAKHGTELSVTQSDRARLIYSAAFRRLQQKAQVFSLESNSSVRSRLTHSIEVSHIGRYIVSTIFENLLKSNDIEEDVKDYWKKNSLAISNVVETACLMHDIGNPPFGHFGEAAITEWASSKELKISIRKAMGDTYSKELLSSLTSDFVKFDGNPQGFRILTRLQGEDGYYGLNLTYTQLAAFFKYTCCPDSQVKDKPFNKKIGYFSSEKAIVEQVWAGLDMKPDDRHPLGFLMEASDDISYCISDIEDGIEKKIISVDGFTSFVEPKIRALKTLYPDKSNDIDILLQSLKSEDNAPIGKFLSFKTHLSNGLVHSVADKFVNNYCDFINCNYRMELISKNSYEHSLLEIFKDYTSTHLFTSSEAESMELSGFAIISGILLEYNKLLSLSKDDFSHLVLGDLKKIRENDLNIERRLYNKLPNKHLNAYKASIASMPLNDPEWSQQKLINALSQVARDKEWHLRAHLIIDFVSGMTDQFAMETYQLLKGIKVK